MLVRPRPREGLTSITELAAPDRFVAAPELAEWVSQAYLAEDGPLFNPDHAHLPAARIGYLWTTAENSRRGRRVVGEAEMPGRALLRSGKWQRARAEEQLRGWFDGVPDFLITIDAIYADKCDDASFCALIDHELYHAAQEHDEFGQPRFNQVTGQPVWTMRGHDVEEFVGVVRRFGIQAAGEQAVDFVLAAAQKPAIAPARLAQSCGTCLRVAA